MNLKKIKVSKTNYENSTPFFNINYIAFIRDEKSGYKTIYAKKAMFLSELIINPTAYKILTLCDGTKNITTIKNEILSIFKNVSEEIISNDLKEILYDYDHIGLIDWKEGISPFMNRYNKILNENLKLELASERDINNLIEFLTKNKNDIGYINPSRRIEEYIDEVALREKLFSYSEEYILLKDFNDEIKGIFSLLIPSNNQSTVSSIGIISMEEKFVSESIKFLIEIIDEISIKKLSKIKYQYIKTSKENDFRNLFLENSFINEGILKNEFKENDIEVISYIFGR